MTVAAGATVTEGSLTSFVLSRTETTDTLSLNLSFGGTAGPMDFIHPLIAYFDVGVSSVTVNVTTNDDTESEPTETITLNLGSGTGYTVGTPASATVYLYDNGSASAVSVAGVAEA